MKGSYFEQSLLKIPEIPAGEHRKVEVTVNVNSGKSYKVLEPLTIHFRKKNYSFQPYPVSCCLNDLKTLKLPPGFDRSINILLYGIAGATKSSFINSISTLLNTSRDIVYRAPTVTRWL